MDDVERNELNAQIADLQHQLKTCQAERDLLATMLAEAEDTRLDNSVQSGLSSGIHEGPRPTAGSPGILIPFPQRKTNEADADE